MPHIEGESLRDKLAKEGELPIPEAVRILRDVVEALKHAHHHNVVHRDIKPDNVLLAEDHALVTDFGVAKAISDATGAIGLTTEGVALGTPAYMSPEQASADPHIDHRADIYAVGVIAYELLTGRTPFAGATQQELLAAHVTQTPDPVTKYRESVPPALAALVMKCLEKKAADRWQTAEELLPQLEALATPSGGLTPVGTVPVAAARRGWKVAAAAGAVAVILAVVLVVTLLPRGSGVTLDPDRVLVAVLDNQTGDPSLDALGAMAGHWITQGLQKSGLVQVVPWLEAQQASQYVASEVDAGKVRNPVMALAEETGASTVIAGAYYRRGETVQYQVEVTDAARGRSLGALDPEIAPLDSPDDAVEALMQRVMGFLAISFDERISDQASSVVQPPSFEAYRAFDDGMAHYLRIEHRQAIPYFRRAFALDTSFVTPLIYATLTNNNLGNWAQSDSLVGIVDRFRDRLSDYDRHWLDYLKARVDGDNTEALLAMRRAAEIAPGSKAVYNRAWIAIRLHRPREAVDALLSIEPERGPMRGYVAYWNQLTIAYHQLGEHQRELEAAQRARQFYPNRLRVVVMEGRALAALGRLDGVQLLWEEAAEHPGDNVSPPRALLDLVGQLCAYGPPDEAAVALERTLRWFEQRPLGERSRFGHRLWHAQALYLARRWDEAEGAYQALAEQSPGNVQIQGALGALAARRGHREEAQRVSLQLENMDWPYLFGVHTFNRALIAAALGERDHAVALLREAYAQGHPNPRNGEWMGREAIDFESLRDYPPFQELMRPKG
jgi:tetratricopeptide (TPR) repeat protein